MTSERGEELFRVCREAIEAETTVDVAIELLKSFQESDESVSSRLLDIIYVLEVEAATPEKKELLVQLVKGIKEALIPSDVISLEIDANHEVHKKALIRHKTRLYFKQTKFNLLREESEGYGKLVTELLEVGTNDVTPEAMKTRVHCLIGQFNLDPNRVLSVVLQCFECLPKQNNFFITLLRAMTLNPDHLLGLVGFQFSFYQSEGKKTPFTLYAMTAALIQAEMLDLVKIIGCLQPNSDGIKRTHRSRSSTASARAKKAETIITTQITAETGGRTNDRGGDETQSFVGMSFSTVSGAQDAEDEKILADMSEENSLAVDQKLGLVCALLEAGEWSHAQYLIDRLPEFYAVQSGPRVCRAIARLIDDAIDPFYRQQCQPRLIINRAEKTEPVKPALPSCESWEDLVDQIVPILWYLGPRIGHNTSTTTKLIRLVTVFFENRANDALTSNDRTASVMMDVVDECLLCSLSMQVNSPNVALSEELWNLLQLFSYEQRYRLYGRWKTYHTNRHPELSVNRAKVLGRTKYLLKRLSKETVKMMGRQLGKLCHIHPMTVLDYMLSMVQTFDNFIGPVVESLKFLTLLEFDVLSFCLIDQLASPDRLQLKSSDGNLSMWLQALGTMIGSIYKKYNVELAGILNYVANQLKNNKGFDLLILREIIQNMSSVESSLTVTEEQLEALTGGEVLKLEAGGFSTARNKRASNRLRDALLDNDLALGLSVLIAQQREFVIHRQSDNLPLKLISDMVDQSRDTLVQFGSFIMQAFKYDEYLKRIPNTAELMEEYGLPLDVSMFMTRMFFNHMINEAYFEQKKQRRALETDGSAKLDENQKFLFFKDAMDTVVNKFCTELAAVHTLSSSHQVKTVGMKLLTTFWMLSGYDIEVPTAAYERAVENLKRQMRDADSSTELSRNKRTKEVERLTALENKLHEEKRKQTDHVDRIRKWLDSCQKDLFAEKSAASIPFLATCVLKRAIFSESDAIFSAKFLLLLHALKNTYFQTMIFFDKTFMDLLPFISGLTEHEASAFGRFLDILLGQANKWNLSKDLFEKECYKYPGFLLKIGGKTTQDPLDWETFKQLTLKWQTRTLKCYLAVLKNAKAEYSLIRNSFVVLAKMTSSFPILLDHHSAMEESVLTLQKREKGTRDDLALLASSYAARLKFMQKSLVEKSVYCGKPDKVKKVAAKTPTISNGTESAAAEKTNKPEKVEKKLVNEASSTPEGKKRRRTERGKENEDTTASSKSTDNNSKESSVTPTTPAKSESKETVEDGEVTPEVPVPKRAKSSSTQNGREEEPDSKKERESKERASKERSTDKIPKGKRRDETEKKDHETERHREEKRLDKKDDEKQEKRRAETPKEKKPSELRRSLHERTEKRTEKEAKIEKKEEKREDEKKDERRKEEKEDAKKRKEPVKEEPPSVKDEKVREKREDKKEEREKKDQEKSRRSEVIKEEKTEKHRESKKENREEKRDHHQKEEMPKEEHKHDRKEGRHKEEIKDEEKKNERKRITIDHRDEPGIKISKTLAGARSVKVEKPSAPVTGRKHREISPPARDVSSRRTSTKESSRSSRR